MKVGKTTRFGRPPGRRSCPVQEKVTHKIKQLLEERLSQHEIKPHLTGSDLHQQLVKEGYKIGRTTVYKVLHNQLAHLI
jgi:Fe2+ or Zn2+ uptake regulation protein